MISPKSQEMRLKLSAKALEGARDAKNPDDFKWCVCEALNYLVEALAIGTPSVEDKAPQ